MTSGALLAAPDVGRSFPIRSKKVNPLVGNAVLARSRPSRRQKPAEWEQDSCRENDCGDDVSAGHGSSLFTRPGRVLVRERLGELIVFVGEA